MLDKITAILDTDKFNIDAALAHPAVLSIRALLASAAISPKGPMALQEIDEKLRKSRLNEQQRIACKVALDRAGLIAA